MSRRWMPGPERALSRRAALRLGAQAALMVAAIVILLSGLATWVVLRDQSSAAADALRSAIARADDVTDPPAGVWLVVRDAQGRLTATPGLPAGLPDAGALGRVAATGGVETRDLHINDREYRVRTQPRGGVTVQAALDLRPDHEERRRLLIALLSSGLVGLVLAAVSGAWLGWRAVRPLGDALALQRRFVADASHELRTPLTLLTTRAQLLRRRLPPEAGPAAVLADVDGIVADSAQLTAILDDLLLAADPRDGEAAGDPVDLVALCADVVRSGGPAAEQRGIRLASHAPPREVMVRGRPVSLRRMLTALLDNAVRHATAEVTVTVSVEPRRKRDARAVIEVTDDGPGIDPAVRERLFDRFFSQREGDPAAGPRRGYGLGLALVSEIVARHGGTVSVHGAAGAGTTMRVALPAAARTAG